MGLGCVSVDLDSLVHYCRIHGLPESVLDGSHARTLVYDVAVPRLVELFGRRGLPFTLFAIGEDLEEPRAAQALRAARDAGAEVGNHSYSHDYALSRRGLVAIHEDLERAAQAISRVTGRRPAGFRAPGYTLSPELYQAVEATGHRYGSSTFPAAPYYGAKAAVMGAMRLVGRRSRAILDSPRVLTAPRHPYFPAPSAPYTRGEGRVLELPITTTPGARLPFIGTFVVAMPRALVRTAYRSLRGEPLLNLELHGLDVLDADDGIPPAVVARQRDARIPYRDKLARLDEVLGWLAGEFDTMTLEAAAQKLAPSARTVV